MGAVESTPAERPGGYQPDFLTAHVKSASQMLAPRPAHVPPPASGYEPKVGTDSIAIAQAKKAQQAISSKSPTKFAGASAYGADTFMNAHVQQLAERERTPPKHTVSQPKVGNDAWLMEKQRISAKLRDTSIRNKFGLWNGPDGHQTIDGCACGPSSLSLDRPSPPLFSAATSKQCS